MNAPEHKDEGSTKRTNFSLSGPLGGDFSFRLFGNLDKTQADARDINQGHQSERTGIYADTLPAGREGVKNKNIDGLVRWEFAPMQSLEFEAGYSRQGNLYAGDTQNTNSNDLVKENYGKETNRLYRNTYSVTRTAPGQRGDHQQLGAVRTHPQLAQRRRHGRRHRGSLTATSSRISIWRM